MRDINERGGGRITLRVRIHPSAPNNQLLGWNKAGELRIRIKAPPVEGRANRELVSFLAKSLSLGRKDVRIESGEKSRSKTISLPVSVKEILLGLPEV